MLTLTKNGELTVLTQNEIENLDVEMLVYYLKKVAVNLDNNPTEVDRLNEKHLRQEITERVNSKLEEEK